MIVFKPFHGVPKLLVELVDDKCLRIRFTFYCISLISGGSGDTNDEHAMSVPFCFHNYHGMFGRNKINI